jgi:hypothetical protein
MPMSEASQQLYPFEIIGIETHYGTTFDESMGGMKMTTGIIWAFECRRQKRKVPWVELEGKMLPDGTISAGMSLGEMDDYFDDEPVVPDEDDEAGKDESSDSSKAAASPNGASALDSAQTFTAV